MAALLAGQSISKVAEQYKIPRGTVGRWSAEMNNPANGNETLRNTKREHFGQLLDQLATESIETAIEMQKHFRDKKWLNKQPASELGVLYGISIDKMVRLFEARSNTEPEPEEQ